VSESETQVFTTETIRSTAPQYISFS